MESDVYQNYKILRDIYMLYRCISDKDEPNFSLIPRKGDAVYIHFITHLLFLHHLGYVHPRM